MAHFFGGEVAQRLKVIAVIAKGQHLTAQQRPGEHRQRQQRDEAERDPAAHRCGTHRCGTDTPVCAQNWRTISRVNRTPWAKKFARMRSSFPCTVSAS